MGNVLSFTLLIWFFIPFLLASQVFTTPEFLEKRFSPVLRQFFALVTIVSNVVAFLAAVLYGGALAIQKLFESELTRLTSILPGSGSMASDDTQQLQLWISIVVLGIVAGIWAIYGGLSSVAWTDLFTVIVMVAGGITVTLLGLHALAGEDGSLVDGVSVMIERNRAAESPWREAVETNLDNLAKTESYNRLSVIQPLSHPTHPWPGLIFGVFSVSIWYNVLNQFMIQRVLGARDSYHARMGIIFAGFLKVLLPAIVVPPGTGRFRHASRNPHDRALERRQTHGRSGLCPPHSNTGSHRAPRIVPCRAFWCHSIHSEFRPQLDRHDLHTRRLQTLDASQRRRQTPRSGRYHLLGRRSRHRHYPRRLHWSDRRQPLRLHPDALCLLRPPFSAIFLLGILWKRINAKGAVTAVFIGFVFGIAMKAYVQFDAPIRETLPWIPLHPVWLEPYSNQGAINWAVCTVVCVAVSLLTAPPRPEQVTDQLTFNWKKMNIFSNLGSHWYTSVVTWWLVFVLSIVALLVVFSGYVIPTGITP